MIGNTVSHYRILNRIGEGGMGVVYVAEDTRLGRRVAIKFPLTGSDEKHFRARFLREARAVSALNHPNIAAVYDFGETPAGQPYLVMELVTGQSLADLLAAGLTLARAIEIIQDVAAALAEAHRRGVIHRDIKPTNVHLNERGEVKVLDFGLAKQLDEEALAASPEGAAALSLRTRSDVVIGTPLYLSPEQARGARVDARSDLFALGALLYECVAGRPPFSGANVIEIGAQVLHVDPPPPSRLNPRVPAELDRVVMKALAKKADERYQKAEELIAALEPVRTRLAGNDTARTRRLTAQTAALRSSAFLTLSDTLRRPRFSPLVLIGALALALLGVWAYTYSLRPSVYVPLPEAVEFYRRGAEALRDGAYHRASVEFGEAVRLDDRYALAHARLAEALAELDSLDRAKDELLRATSLTIDRRVLLESDALYFDAITATLRRDYKSAVESYEKIARLRPDAPEVYVDLGRAHEKDNETAKAIASYTEAANRDPNYATAYLRLGAVHGRLQNLPAALEVFERAEKIYAARGDAEGQAEVFHQRGFLYDSTGRVADARREFQRALELAQASGNQFQRIHALLGLSAVAYAENNAAQAQQYAREAIETAQANGMDNLTARALVDLGSVYLARSDYPEAEKYYKQAIEYARRSKARRAEATALSNLGSLSIQQSKPDEAISFVNQALPFYRQGNYRQQVSQGLLMLGRANRLKGDYDSALRAFEEQLQLAEQNGDQLQAAIAHEGIGTVLTIQERYTEALAPFHERYAISKFLGRQIGMGYGLAERASVLWQLGRYDEARAALNEAASLADRPDGGYKQLLVNVHVINAELALSQHKFSESKTQAERALDLAGTKYLDDVAEAKRVLGLALAFSGARREGRRLCEEALKTATDLNNLYLISKATLALAQVLLESGDAEGALATALGAQESFARHGQHASEWRAWAVAAQASRQAGDQQKGREFIARAADVLASLQQRWGAEAYDDYLARPDVGHHRRQFDVLAANH